MPSDTLKTAPAAEPVLWADMQDHSRIDEATEQVYVETLLLAARRFVEDFTGRALITQTRELRLDAFPAGGLIRIPRAPALTIVKVDYIDADGAAQTVTASGYQLDAKSEPGRLKPTPSSTGWPATESGRFNAVVVEYTAGFGATAADVPAELKHAIKLLAAHWFEHREAVIDTPEPKRVPIGIEALLWPWRIAFDFGDGGFGA